MLDARAALLASGAYAPIAAAIVAAARQHAVRRPSRSDDGGDDDKVAGSSDDLRIVDLGCGTGYYAGALAAELTGASVLLADRSPTAVRLATRAVPRATGVVLDLWRPLPVRDGTADVAINVFAPRNAPEFARIVRAAGILIVVVPSAAHFTELRRLGATLDVPEGKADRVTEQFSAAGFDLRQTTRVEYLLDTDAELRVQLVDMGPAAHHRANAADDAADPSPIDAQLTVTVSVDVVVFERGSTAGAD
ncbi:methyltransferase domain-containing protein [Agromyces subbeticus]|uniref:methyltransferase domain-containing protein n=1 Tax=Agromyces subbeticus TaxID=293890 RepID=UPI001FDF17D0|nr:methyltransferase domain-containing protein [Agromyces subbeticus]